jgi:hypothetical protein
LNELQGRDPVCYPAVELLDNNQDAEGANLDQAKPDETLRQKDPAPEMLWKVSQETPTV